MTEHTEGRNENQRMISRVRSLIAEAAKHAEGLKMPDHKKQSGDVFEQYVLPNLDNSPELAALLSIIIERDDRTLRSRAEKVVQSIDSLRIEHGISDEEFETRLKSFTDWLNTEGSTFVHSSEEDVSDITLQSPRNTGKIRNMGMMDVYLGHDRFVYGSWQALPHKIAASGNVFRLDLSEKDTSYFVPMDIAQVYKQLPNRENLTESTPETIQSYALNMYRLEDMTEVMANYFAAAFDSVDDMKALLALLKEDADNWHNQNDIPEELQPSYKIIKELHDRFGLLPPLASEVQVSDQISATKL